MGRVQPDASHDNAITRTMTKKNTHRTNFIYPVQPAQPAQAVAEADDEWAALTGPRVPRLRVVRGPGVPRPPAGRRWWRSRKTP
jgi:hypothetical protein